MFGQMRSMMVGLVAAVVGLILLAPILSVRAGQSQAEEPPKAGEQTETKSNAQSAEDHLRLADEYAKKAAAYRAEADTHRAMLDGFRKKVARSPKETMEDSRTKKMRLHCEHYIDAAETLAREAESFAEYHRLRAAELKGQ